MIYKKVAKPLGLIAALLVLPAIALADPKPADLSNAKQMALKKGLPKQTGTPQYTGGGGGTVVVNDRAKSFTKPKIPNNGGKG